MPALNQVHRGLASAPGCALACLCVATGFAPPPCRRGSPAPHWLAGCRARPAPATAEPATRQEKGHAESPRLRKGFPEVECAVGPAHLLLLPGECLAQRVVLPLLIGRLDTAPAAQILVHLGHQLGARVRQLDRHACVLDAAPASLGRYRYHSACAQERTHGNDLATDSPCRFLVGAKERKCCNCL